MVTRVDTGTEHTQRREEGGKARWRMEEGCDAMLWECWRPSNDTCSRLVESLAIFFSSKETNGLWNGAKMVWGGYGESCCP